MDSIIANALQRLDVRVRKGRHWKIRNGGREPVWGVILETEGLKIYQGHLCACTLSLKFVELGAMKSASVFHYEWSDAARCRAIMNQCKALNRDRCIARAIQV